MRRWIHDGKLRAELRPGPYGQQYLVPTGELSALQVALQLRSENPGETSARSRLVSIAGEAVDLPLEEFLDEEAGEPEKVPERPTDDLTV